MSATRKVIPLLNRVLVEKLLAPTKTAGGIMLPETTSKKVCFQLCLLHRVQNADGHDATLGFACGYFALLVFREDIRNHNSSMPAPAFLFTCHIAHLSSGTCLERRSYCFKQLLAICLL
jgi:Chaperonin 10 Kd subunit